MRLIEEDVQLSQQHENQLKAENPIAYAQPVVPLEVLLQQILEAQQQILNLQKSSQNNLPKGDSVYTEKRNSFMEQSLYKQQGNQTIH